MDSRPGESIDFESMFPMSSSPGAPTKHIKSALMFDMVIEKEFLSKERFKLMMTMHQKFLDSGGLSGKWQTLISKGIIFAVYEKSNHKSGTQADLSMQNLSLLDLSNRDLRCVNVLGSIYQMKNAINSNFENALFTDCYWIETNFENSNLSRVDFSRGDLSGSNFRNCNLSFCDFENCKLTNADFTGANLNGARFPGAKLEGIKY